MKSSTELFEEVLEVLEYSSEYTFISKKIVVSDDFAIQDALV